MGFWSDIFGGPSSAEQGIATNEQSLGQSLGDAFHEQFGQQEGVLGNLNQQLTPIANLGPNQQGFSAQELAAINSAAINSAGAAARNAAQSTGGVLAGE